MSVVAAVKQGGRIWFGADTQLTCGSDCYNNLNVRDLKVAKLDNGILLSFTGETSTAQMILAYPEWFTVDEKKGLTKEHIVTKIIPRMFEKLDEEEMLERDGKDSPPEMKVSMLIAYKDKLFAIERGFHVVRYDDYQATGSGANAVKYGLSVLDKSKDINEQLVRLLRISAKQDSNVSAPFVLIDTKKLEYTIVKE